MRSIEDSLLKQIDQAMADLLTAQLAQAYTADLVYQVGLRQGKYAGLQQARNYVVQLMQDKADKDGDL